MSELSTLLEMGFSQRKAEKALVVTGNKGVEPAMEWLLAHIDDPDVDEQFEFQMSEQDLCKGIDSYGNQDSNLSAGAGDEKPSETDEINTTQDNLSYEPKSLKCDECGKKFRTDAEVEFHAVKSGHQSFSESTEEIKPLSEEEKKEQLRKLEEKIKQRRAEREEQEKREALEREKNRRKTGQEMTHTRQRLEEEEMKRLADQKRKEKLEAKLARQRVLEEIERDKQARKEKFGTGSGAPITSGPTLTHCVNESQPMHAKKDYDQCRLQIRLTNGQCLTQTFGPNEELAAVRLYVQLNRTDGDGSFSLMTNFPKKVFAEEDMNKPLSTLGLVPSAVLIVTKQQ